MSETGVFDLTRLDPVLAQFGGGSRSDLLPALHATQAVYGYLPAPALEALSHLLRVPLADIHGVVEFYTMFYDEPVGERIVRVCTDPSCAARGAEATLQAACHRAGVEPGGTGEDGAVTVERATCLGLCDQAPAALVDDFALTHVGADEVDRLFSASRGNSALRVTGEPRVLTGPIGALDPADLAAHRAEGAFRALEQAVTQMTPDQVIDVLKESNLVGRGGAAFPTGLKWQFTRAADGDIKFAVCNADESEPGTFKDRVLLEGNPFAVLEGLALCGYTIGATQGYVFIRGEYPRAAEIVQQAIDAAYEANLLGNNILGSDFHFDVTLRRGAGAYICGEETALFEAIEGRRGFSRVKPPFPTTHGLFGLPTAINNVETLAQVPGILLNGADWFKQWGTEDSTGLKLFAVSGHVNQPGVVEAPFGLTTRELVEQWCGGFDGEPQAVLMGGAAGVFLTPDQFDTPLLYEALRPLGASVGSGAVMVFNDTVDLRDILTRLAHFFAHESCGKCFPCQLGTQRQAEILHRIAHGDARPGDEQLLRDIAQVMTDASLCGLGQTAGMAVVSAIDLWPEITRPGADEEPAAH